MILPDANLLLYAYDRSSRFHQRAARWWKDCMEGDEEVGLAAVTVFAFVRIATSARAFAEPLTAEEAIAHVDSWLERPGVRFIEAAYWTRVGKLLKEVGTAGNLVSDAQLAAIALEEGAVVHTADVDFRRFKNVQAVFPLEEG